MTDKRARLARIKKWAHDFIPAGETNWLITELEAAWAEVERLNKVSEGWHQESERYRRCAEAAEKRVKVLEEALNSMARVASRGHVPDDVFDAMARIRSAALSETGEGKR